jgi:hypothetical protein
MRVFLSAVRMLSVGSFITGAYHKKSRGRAATTMKKKGKSCADHMTSTSDDYDLYIPNFGFQFQLQHVQISLK